MFALANGHIGLRANLDEGEPFGLPGSYLNSFYELRPLPHAEAAYGNPESGQTLVNVTNGKIIRLLVDDEPFDLRYGELLSHERELDLRNGVLRRTVEWISPAGRRRSSAIDAAGLLRPASRRSDSLRGRAPGRTRAGGRPVRAGRQRARACPLRGPACGRGPGLTAAVRGTLVLRESGRPRALDEVEQAVPGRRDGSPRCWA